MCRPVSRPIAAIIVAEFDATGRSSIRMFHTFVPGKTEHPDAPGSDGPGGIGRLEKVRQSTMRGEVDGRGLGGE
jgi:hypothetical protein